MNRLNYLTTITYEVLIRRTSRRKTASIQVEAGEVSVIVPNTLSDERIRALVANKHSWILDKLARNEQIEPVRDKPLVSGSAFPYLGRNYRLKVLDGPYEPAKLKQGRLEVTVPGGANYPKALRNAMVRWYRRQANKKLVEKADRYAQLIGVEPASVKVKSFQSRWGSCTAKGEIQFNWVIIMAPNRIVDYVVAHELCHLIHHDHSQRFWKALEQVIPDYAECRNWLRENGAKLVL